MTWRSLTPSHIRVYRTANTPMKQHGKDRAELCAAMRADELLAADDMDGRRVRLTVLEAVRELTSKEPAGKGAAVH